MSKSMLELSPYWMYKENMAFTEGAVGDILSLVSPEDYKEIKELGLEIKEMVDPDPLENAFNKNPKEAINNEHGISTGVGSYPYTTMPSSVNKNTYADPHSYVELNEKIRAFTDKVKALMNSEKGQEFQKKHPNAAAFVNYHTKLYDDFCDGTDSYEKLTTIPGAEWYVTNSNDYLTTMEKDGQKVERDLEGYENALSTLHFDQITKNFEEQYKTQEKLNDPSITLEEKNALVEEQKKLMNDSLKEYDHLTSPETGEKVKDFFESYKTNLQGKRGAKILKEQTERKLKALEQGWDPAYTQDAEQLEKIAKQCKKNAKYIDEADVPEFAALSQKLKKVADLDPSDRLFNTQAEFVDYYQAYSDALNDLLEESRKPEVQRSLNKANSLNDELNKKLPNAKLSGLIDDRKGLKYLDAHNLDYFAQQTNFRSRGITTENGKLVYNENKLAEDEKKYQDIYAQAEANHAKFSEFSEQLKAAKSTARDDEYNELNNALDIITNTETESVSYDDLERDLSLASKNADAYSKANTGKPVGSPEEIQKENQRRQLAAQIKQYADQQLEALHKIDKKDLDVYRSAYYHAEDIEDEKAVAQNFVKNSNEMPPPPKKIDHTFLKKTILNTSAISSSITAYAGDDFVKQDEASIMEQGAHMIDHYQKVVSFDKKPTIFGINDDKFVELHANTYSQKKQAEAAMKDVDDNLDKLLSNEEIKRSPGMKANLEFTRSFGEAAKNGRDKFATARKLPDGNFPFAHPDWSNEDVNGKMFSRADFDGMLTGMGFSKLAKSVDKSIELTEQLDGAYLTDEQRKEYTRQITTHNKYRYDIYDRMRTPEYENNYRRFFKDSKTGGFDNDIKGERGTHIHSNELKAQNKALENGWDVTRINDVNAINNILHYFDNIVKVTDTLKDPGLTKLNALAKNMQELAPEKQKFSNTAEYAAYSMQFARGMKQLYDEMAKPETQKTIDKYRKSHKDLLNDTIPFRSKDAFDQFKNDTELYSKELDLKNMDLSKYPPDKRAEKQKELELASELADVKLSRKTINNIAKQAAAKLKFMEENLDGQRKENSKYYTNMKNALMAVANLEDGEWNYEDVQSKLQSLSFDSGNYSEKRSGTFKSKEGQQRLDFADELSTFANDSLKELKNATKDLDFNGYVFLDHYEKDLKKDLDIHQGMEELAIKQSYSHALENYVDTAINTAANTKQYLDFFNADSKKRSSASKEYNEIIEAAQFLNDPEDSVVYSSPVSYASQMETLIEKLDAYAELHSGALFGDRKLRADQAKAYSAQLKKDLNTVYKSMNGMPYVAPTVASTRDELNDDIKHIKEQISSDEQDKALTPEGKQYTLAQVKEYISNGLKDPNVIASHTPESIKDLLKTSAAIQYMIANKEYGPDYLFDKEIAEIEAHPMLDSPVYQEMVDKMSFDELVAAVQDPEPFVNKYYIEENNSIFREEQQKREKWLADPNTIVPIEDEAFDRERFKLQAYRNGYSKDIDEKMLDTIYDGFEAFGNELDFAHIDMMKNVMNDVMKGKGKIEDRRKKVLSDTKNVALDGTNDIEYDLLGEIEERINENEKRYDYTFEKDIKPEENKTKEAEPRHPNLGTMLFDRTIAGFKKRTLDRLEKAQEEKSENIHTYPNLLKSAVIAENLKIENGGNDTVPFDYDRASELERQISKSTTFRTMVKSMTNEQIVDSIKNPKKFIDQFNKNIKLEQAEQERIAKEEQEKIAKAEHEEKLAHMLNDPLADIPEAAEGEEDDLDPLNAATLDDNVVPEEKERRKGIKEIGGSIEIDLDEYELDEDSPEKDPLNVSMLDEDIAGEDLNTTAHFAEDVQNELNASQQDIEINNNEIIDNDALNDTILDIDLEDEAEEEIEIVENKILSASAYRAPKKDFDFDFDLSDSEEMQRPRRDSVKPNSGEELSEEDMKAFKDSKDAARKEAAIEAEKLAIKKKETDTYTKFDEWLKKYPKGSEDYIDDDDDEDEMDKVPEDIRKFEKEEMDPISRGLKGLSVVVNFPDARELNDHAIDVLNLQTFLKPQGSRVNEPNRAEIWNEAIGDSIYNLKEMLNNEDYLQQVFERAEKYGPMVNQKDMVNDIFKGLDKLNEHLNAGFDTAKYREKYNEYKLAKNGGVMEEQPKVNEQPDHKVEQPEVNEQQQEIDTEKLNNSVDSFTEDEDEDSLNEAIEKLKNGLKGNESPDTLREILTDIIAFEKEKQYSNGDVVVDDDCHRETVEQLQNDPAFVKTLNEIEDKDLSSVIKDHEKFYQDFQKTAEGKDLSEEQPKPEEKKEEEPVINVEGNADYVGSVKEYQDEITAKLNKGEPKNEDEFISRKISIKSNFAAIIATRSIWKESSQKTSEELAKEAYDRSPEEFHNFYKDLSNKTANKNKIWDQLMDEDKAFDLMFKNVWDWDSLQKLAKFALTKDGKGAVMKYADAKKTLDNLSPANDRNEKSVLDIEKQRKLEEENPIMRP